MGTTLPASAVKTNLDAASDDPKQGRGDLSGNVDKFNTLLDAFGAAAQLNVSDGLTTSAQASGTPDDLVVQAVAAGGLEVTASGIQIKKADTTVSTTSSGLAVALASNPGLEVSSGLKAKAGEGVGVSAGGIDLAFSTLADASSTVDTANDPLCIFDQSGQVHKKVVPNDLGIAGGLALISVGTASGSATLDFTGIDSTYDAYLFVLSGIQPVTNAQPLRMRVQVSSTWQTGGTYRYVTTRHVDSGAVTENDSGGDTTLKLFDTVGNGSDESLGGIVWLFDPSSTAFHKNFYFDIVAIDTWAGYMRGAGHWSGGVGAVTGVRFYFASGNIDEGRIQMYGFKKAV